MSLDPGIGELSQNLALSVGAHRVGAQGATTSTKKVMDLRSTGYLSVEPGDFAVVTVREEIALGPQHVGRFGLRSKYARKGLIATTGPQIDPGFHGRLILGLTNLTPKAITLSYDDDLVSVEFHQLVEPTEKPYDGPFQGKMRLGAEDRGLGRHGPSRRS